MPGFLMFQKFSPNKHESFSITAVRGPKSSDILISRIIKDHFVSFVQIPTVSSETDFQTPSQLITVNGILKWIVQHMTRIGTQLTKDKCDTFQSPNGATKSSFCRLQFPSPEYEQRNSIWFLIQICKGIVWRSSLAEILFLTTARLDDFLLLLF